jgi:hypothetical protein
MLAPVPIAVKVARVRTDRVAAAIAAAAEHGVRWRQCGSQLIWDGLEQLSAQDRALLEELQSEVEERLHDPADTDRNDRWMSSISRLSWSPAQRAPPR